MRLETRSCGRLISTQTGHLQSRGRCTLCPRGNSSERPACLPLKPGWVQDPWLLLLLPPLCAFLARFARLRPALVHLPHSLERHAHVHRQTTLGDSFVANGAFSLLPKYCHFASTTCYN